MHLGTKWEFQPAFCWLISTAEIENSNLNYVRCSIANEQLELMQKIVKKGEIMITENRFAADVMTINVKYSLLLVSPVLQLIPLNWNSSIIRGKSQRTKQIYPSNVFITLSPQGQLEYQQVWPPLSLLQMSGSKYIYGSMYMYGMCP